MRWLVVGSITALARPAEAEMGCKWGPIPPSFFVPRERDLISSDTYGVRGSLTFKITIPDGGRRYCIVAVESTSVAPALSVGTTPCNLVPYVDVGARCVFEDFVDDNTEIRLTPQTSLGLNDYRSECRPVRLDIACRVDRPGSCKSGGNMPSSDSFRGTFHFPGASTSWSEIWRSKVPAGVDIVHARVSSLWPNFRLMLLHGSVETRAVGATFTFGHGQMSQTIYRHIASTGEYFVRLEGRFCGRFDMDIKYESHLAEKTFTALSPAYFFGSPVLCSGGQLIEKWEQVDTLKVADIFELQSFTSTITLHITQASLLRLRVGHYSGPIGPFQLRLVKDNTVIQSGVRLPLTSQTQMLAAELNIGTYELLLELLAVPLGALHTCRMVQVRLVVDSIHAGWPKPACGAPSMLEGEIIRKIDDDFAPRWMDAAATITHGGIAQLITFSISKDPVETVDTVLRAAVQSDFLHSGLIVAVLDGDGLPVSTPLDSDTGCYNFVDACKNCSISLVTSAFQTARTDCIYYSLDVAHLSHAADLCRTQLPDIPVELAFQRGDARISGVFALPEGEAGISVPDKAIVVAYGTADGHEVLFRRGTVHGHTHMVSEGGVDMSVQVKPQVARVQPGCVHLKLMVYAVLPEKIPWCPWKVDGMRFHEDMAALMKGEVQTAETYINSDVQTWLKGIRLDIPLEGAYFRLEAHVHLPLFGVS